MYDILYCIVCFNFLYVLENGEQIQDISETINNFTFTQVSKEQVNQNNIIILKGNMNYTTKEYKYYIEHVSDGVINNMKVEERNNIDNEMNENDNGSEMSNIFNDLNSIGEEKQYKSSS